MTRRLLLPWLLLTVPACVLGTGPDDGLLDEAAEWQRTYDELRTGGKEDGWRCSGVLVPDESGFGNRIALTFDDGPSAATTPKVMDVLRRHHAPATFFVMGKNLADPANRAIAQEIDADPLFELGNHSWSHPNIARLGASDVASEIDSTLGALGDLGAEPRWFRFPYGSATCATADAVRSRDLTVVGWHIDSADWCFAAGGGTCSPATFAEVPSAYRSDMTGYVLQQAQRRGGGVLLFHDIKRYTADALDGVLTALESAGFTFASLSDATLFPILNGAPPPASIGAACTGPEQCAGPSGLLCHPAGFCTTTCAGFCPGADTFCIADPATAGGTCVVKAGSGNHSCADLPGTIRVRADRFVGASGTPAASADVCAPPG